MIGKVYNFERGVSRISRIYRLGYPYLKAYLEQESRFFLDTSFNVYKGSTDHLKIDKISNEFLKRCAMTREGLPYKVEARGNVGSCLFNAVSVLLIGDQSLSSELRVRTCHELMENREFYKS